jgi:hypothetical protein
LVERRVLAACDHRREVNEHVDCVERGLEPIGRRFLGGISPDGARFVAGRDDRR